MVENSHQPSHTFGSMTYSELHAMTKLLDDPDMDIFKQIEDRMVQVGYKIVPLLENSWNESSDLVVRDRIENIIDKINFTNILQEFTVWNNSKEADLLELMVLINRLQYPLVDCKSFQKTIDDQVREIWLELNDNLTAFEKVNVINKMIYDLWKYKSINDYNHDMFQYNFLSNMMESKYGNQFSMACYYLIITEKLDLPIYPVLLEDQLILVYLNTHRPPEEAEIENIMFYINPNEEGIVFDESSIKHWVGKHKLDNKTDYYLPVSLKHLANAYINRLISGYEVEEDEKKVDFLSTLIV